MPIIEEFFFGAKPLSPGDWPISLLDFIIFIICYSIATCGNEEDKKNNIVRPKPAIRFQPVVRYEPVLRMEIPDQSIITRNNQHHASLLPPIPSNSPLALPP